MSLAKKVYNIYHRTDPVAYRFEPLVAKDYCRYKPVGIQACGIKCDYSEVPLELIENIDTVNTCPLSRNSTPVENLNHRLDYILRDSIGGSASDYLSMWYTHTSYWSNYDVAYFIYTRLFPELDKTMEDFLKPEEKIPNFDLQLDQDL
ncbi:probable phospholipase YOR022C, mitochondrial isoform X2 [Acyrthosiphon pisum]|uniref:DDHD domain-containing protein n=1 Tax=Acyrthosiphon pisum TaxID=7029 RepID=A0A8R2D2K0_ACYPI|nr:probable phospholipase YOR022C, mitochondrial isoform X2 [Acyrthosiphon pisum]|eukprot:XP_016656642.1 PREDICTED: probable phospholipase YOR022C, mitochondrial isoform X2 [Acyrthosiphon pisum]